MEIIESIFVFIAFAFVVFFLAFIVIVGGHGMFEMIKNIL